MEPFSPEAGASRTRSSQVLRLVSLSTCAVSFRRNGSLKGGSLGHLHNVGWHTHIYHLRWPSPTPSRQRPTHAAMLRTPSGPLQAQMERCAQWRACVPECQGHARGTRGDVRSWLDAWRGGDTGASAGTHALDTRCESDRERGGAQANVMRGGGLVTCCLSLSQGNASVEASGCRQTHAPQPPCRRHTGPPL